MLDFDALGYPLPDDGYDRLLPNISLSADFFNTALTWTDHDVQG